MKKKTLKIIILVALANVLFFTVVWAWSYFVTIPINGDGALSITGTVYEWTNAPKGAKSTIYVDYFIPNTEWEIKTNCYLRLRYTTDIEKTLKGMQENVAHGFSIVPLGDVVVEMGWKESIEGRDKEIYRWERTSDNTGNIYAWIIAPGEGEYIVKASKPGYLEVLGEVTHHKAYSHAVMIVILARDDD